MGEGTASLNSFPSCCTLLLKHIQPLPLMTSDKSSRMVNNPLAQIQSNHSLKTVPIHGQEPGKVSGEANPMTSEEHCVALKV